MHLGLFIQAPVEGHVGSVQVTNAANNAAVSVLAQGSLGTWAGVSLEAVAGPGLLV